MPNMSMIINVRVVGKGEQTLVLSHGYGANQSVWDSVVPHLSQKYRILLFDWNFSGTVDHSRTKSTAVDTAKYSSFSAFSDDLISLVDQMDLEGVVFVGHSMAGMIGCLASIRRPDLFSRLVLVGASPRYLNSEDYEGGLQKEEVETLLSQIESDFRSWIESFVVLVIGVNDPVSIEKLGRSFERMSPEIALAVGRTIFLGDMRGILERVEVPCTIIQLSNDFVVPVSVGHYMHSKMKGTTTLEIIESDGHFPQLTCPGMLLQTLDRVLLALPKK